MSVELKPIGITCNLSCKYCYQNTSRYAGNISCLYDLNTMTKALLKKKSHFILFGGEALLLPKKDLESLWAFGLEHYGKNAIQTNGSLIDDEIIELFIKYRVHPGISIDGPGKLNDIRFAGSIEKTRKATQKTEQAIEKLCQKGIYPGLIVTLHNQNATPDRLSDMCEWFQKLDLMGIRSIRLHILEAYNNTIRNQYALSVDENINALLCFEALETKLANIQFDIFQEMNQLLVANDKYVSCIWNACDPYTTQSVYGIEGDGKKTNCGRENKDGIEYVKAGMIGYERYLLLYHTPYEYGGCQGCRFFLMCKGNCPGTAIDGDWRNRTEHCEIWFFLFEYFEKKMVKQNITPVSLYPDLARFEEKMIQHWSNGQSESLHNVVNS